MKRTSTPKMVASTGAVKTAPGFVTAISLAAGSDAATVVLDNSTASGGTDVWKLAAIAGGGDSISFPIPVWFSIGIYATLTGTSPVVSVAYE